MITYVGCLIKWYNEYLPIKDAEHQLNLEISENETRKDFSKAERIDYARRLERIESLKAEKRMKAGKADPSQNSDEGQRTDDTIAQKLGIGSRDTYRKEKYIVDHKESLSTGVREYWVVDPDKSIVTIYNFEADTMMEYPFGEEIPVGIFEGFSVKIQ